MRTLAFSALSLIVSSVILSMLVPSATGQEKATANQAASPAEQLKKSLETWQDLKAKCGGNYSYSTGFQSWAGFGNSSQIVVRANKVVERKYMEFNRNLPLAGEPGKEPKLPGESWTETDKQLGSHKKGAPPKTLDDLYADAQKVVATKLSPQQRLYVMFDKQGLLQSCFYVDTRISDDAPKTGVSIGNVQLQLPNK
jgi:hypothetical protein